MPRSSNENNRNLGTFIALIGLLLGCAALLVLGAMANLPIMGFCFVGFVFLLMASFHYLVWGYWLSRRPRRGSEEIDRTG